MLKRILFILICVPTLVFAQDFSDDPADALNGYLKMRKGYKHSSTKQFSKTEQMEMDDYCFDMQEKFPDAWQTDLMWYINDHFIDVRSDKIISAYNKNSSDSRVVKALFGFYELTNRQSDVAKLAPKVSDYYSSNVLKYYENVLPSSGVLIVSSDEDAIPLYILQHHKKKGKNVTIVNMDFLINNDYRKRMASKLGTGSMKFFGNETNFIKTALSNSNVHLSTTVPQGYLSKCSSSAYLTGLTYQIQVSDQKKSLEAFWRKIHDANIEQIKLNSRERRLYSNYLPPLLTLYKLRGNKGEERNKLKVAIKAIATKVGQTKTVNDILTGYE